MTRTLSQSAGQKLMLAFNGLEAPDWLLTQVRQQALGGVTLFRHWNTGSPAQIRALTDVLHQTARASGQLPLLVAADQEGGQLVGIAGCTPWPGNMALGATGSTELAEQFGHALGLELAAMGVNVNYAPDCDVNNNPANPVIGVRSFGEAPHAVARLAAAMVRGMQDAGVAATAKHFPGHGDVEGDTHHGSVVVPHSTARLHATELVPFTALIAADVKLMMSAHVAVPAIDDDGTPATLSHALLTGLLREQLGFGGLIVSDAMNMHAITQGPGQIIDMLAAVAAGVDLLLVMDAPDASLRVASGIRQAAARRLIDTDALHRSAGRVLALKHWLAGFEQPDLGVIGCAAHHALAHDIAARSVTLVRNQAGLLPVRLPASARVAVVMPELRDLTPADTSSLEQCGLAETVRRYHPATEAHQMSADPTETEIHDLCQRLAGADLVIVGTVNAQAQPGQAACVQALLRANLPTIAVALRLPYDLLSYPEAPTYACTYGVQQPSLDALAAALFGQQPWRGTLPVSLPSLYPLGHGVS